MLAAARSLGYLVASAAGAAAGLLGSFKFGYTYAGLPVGLLVGLCLSLAVFVVAGLFFSSRGASAAAAAGWLVMVVLLSMRRPEGDLVVPATALGVCWLLVGTVVAGLSLSVPYAAISPRPDSGGPSADRLVEEESSGRAPTSR